MNSCPICNNTTATLRHTGSVDGVAVECPRCGKYRMSGTMLAGTSQLSDEERFRISSYTRERTLHGRPTPTILSSGSPMRRVADGYTIGWDGIVASGDFPRTISERLDRTLLNFARVVPEPGIWLELNRDVDSVLSYSKNNVVWEYTLAQLYDDRLIERDGMRVRLTVKGWNRVAEIERGAVAQQYKQAFVAMWFDPSLDKAWADGFKPGIEDGTDTKALRVDLKEHNEKICDVLIAEIRKSRFLIADFTGSRGGVYFEAGFAKGLGIPVIFTCQKGEWEKQLHFDTRQYNHIIWDTPADLKLRLSNRIAATVPPAAPHIGGSWA